MKDNYEYRKKMYYYCNESNKILQHDMPRNFSWVIENKLGGISKINSDKDILVLQTLGVRKIYYFLEKITLMILILGILKLIIFIVLTQCPQN